MEKFGIISKIQEIYKGGGNIIQYLKNFNDRSENTLEDILISYDFQAGSYIQFVQKNADFNRLYTQAIADVISGLGEVNSVLEAGVGEATTLGNVATKLNNKINCGGFDISWSRIKYAKEYTSSLNVPVFLCTGDLFNCPFADSAIDVVYTSHSIEPNGGREEEALRELYRITNKYLVLLEPSFELADEKARDRIKSHGYITNLRSVVEQLNYKLIEYRLFDHSANPLNPTALYVIDKNRDAESKHLIKPSCPITKTQLDERIDHFYSKDAFLSYPRINAIPCLAPFNAILTTKMDEE